MNDPEWVARIVDAGQQAPVKRGIRVADFSPEVRVLSDLVTTTRNVVAAVVASAGGKPGQVEPYPGMITVVDDVKFAQRKAAHEALVARVLPPEPDGTVEPPGA